MNDVRLWDVSVERLVEITGPDAFHFTNRLITRDLSKCRVGQYRFVVITDQHGGIIRESVRRKLVGIELAGEPIEFNATKWPVASDGKQISHVTSAIYSPRLRKNVGFAMIPVAQSEHGTSLTASLPGVGMRTVTVVPMPFVDPSKQIPKA